MGRRIYYRRRSRRLRTGRKNFLPSILVAIVLGYAIWEETDKNLNMLFIGIVVFGMYRHSKYCSKILVRQEIEERIRKNGTVDQLLSVKKC